MFKLEPVEGVQASEPFQVTIRGDLAWEDTGDVPRNVTLLLKDSRGNCWGPKHFGRTSDPFQFPIQNGGVPCEEIDYGSTLLKHDDQLAIAAKYAPVEPAE